MRFARMCLMLSAFAALAGSTYACGAGDPGMDDSNVKDGDGTKVDGDAPGARKLAPLPSRGSTIRSVTNVPSAVMRNVEANMK